MLYGTRCHRLLLLLFLLAFCDYELLLWVACCGGGDRLSSLLDS
jgi:hypothetical protein